MLILRLKIIFFLTCFSLLINTSSSSSNIACKYEMSAYTKIGELYHCSVLTALNIIDQESAHIGAISGFHTASKTDDDVAGFRVEKKMIRYFPRGLDVFFKNIKAFYFQNCKFKEIYQEDLKPFPKLTYLYIPNSDIEVIEEGLFAYNPSLIVLGVEGSKVTHIDPNVFDHLIKLDHFWFEQVPCANVKYISDSRSKVEEAIKNIKTRCISIDYLQLDADLKGLERESKILNSEEFKKKIESFEKSNKNSIFLKHRPLKGKFDNLKALTDKELVFSNATTPTTDLDIQTITNDGKCTTKTNPLTHLIIELKNATIDLKSSQCGLREEFSDLKDQISGNVVTKLSELNSKVYGIESSTSQNLQDFAESFKDIKKEMASKFHKIIISFDEKLKGIEKRMTTKFEEILEEKLRKILDEKLENV